MSFLRKSAFTFITQLLLMVVGMATGVLVARVLGPESKGQAALMSMVTQLLFMLFSLGLGSAFSFLTARKKYPYSSILTLAFVAAGGLGGVALAVFYLSLPLHHGIWEGIPAQLIFFSVLLTFLVIVNSYLGRIIVGLGRVYSMNIGDSVYSISNFLAVLIFLIIWPLGLSGVVAALWLASAFQFLALLYFLRAEIGITCFWRGRLIGESLNYGCKSYLLLLINFLNYRLDLLLLKHFSDDAAVGLYSLAVTMAELMWLIPSATVAPLFSGIAQSTSDDKSAMTIRTVRWSLIFLAVLAIVGFFLGKPFISILYGVDFLPAYRPFLWLLPGICLFPLFKLLIVDLAARGNPGYGTIASAIALVTNVVANIILIPRFGMEGAAMATSLSYSFMSAISLSFFVRSTSCSLKDLFLVDAEDRSFLKEKVRIVGKFFRSRR